MPCPRSSSAIWNPTSSSVSRTAPPGTAGRSRVEVKQVLTESVGVSFAQGPGPVPAVADATGRAGPSRHDRPPARGTASDDAGHRRRERGGEVVLPRGGGRVRPPPARRQACAVGAGPVAHRSSATSSGRCIDTAGSLPGKSKRSSASSSRCPVEIAASQALVPMAVNLAVTTGRTVYDSLYLGAGHPAGRRGLDRRRGASSTRSKARTPWPGTFGCWAIVRIRLAAIMSAPPFRPVNSSQRWTITSQYAWSSSIRNARRPGLLAADQRRAAASEEVQDVLAPACSSTGSTGMANSTGFSVRWNHRLRAGPS